MKTTDKTIYMCFLNCNLTQQRKIIIELPAGHWWILPDAVNTVKCSWWWPKTSPETWRAD